MTEANNKQSSFTYASTSDDVLQSVSLLGKTVLITGASSGLGLESARCFAAAGAKVILAARNLAKIEQAKQHILASVPTAQLSIVLLDLSDLNSVRSAAQQLLQQLPQQKQSIDILINNAGVMACPFELTAQGFELQFGSNHLGHFLFTCLIAPLLTPHVDARVICLSSAAHKFAAPNLDDPNYLHRPYNKWQAYGEAKSANALFALALNARLKNKGIECFSVHPGMIATELGRHLEPEDLKMFSGGGSNKEKDKKKDKTEKPKTENHSEIQKSDKPKRPAFKSIAQGAATSVWAATSPTLKGKGGCYCEDCQIAEPSSKPTHGYADYIADKNLAEKLWILSEQLVSERFEF